MLNDTVWYGRANAIPADALNNNSCAAGRITLLLSTNMGYIGDRLRLSPEQLALQAGEYMPRQRLSFHNVPTKRGKYRLSELNQCGGPVLRQGNFALMGNGSALIDGYFVRDNQPNWVRIKTIDSTSRTVTGTFKATLLADSLGRVARFRRGRFTAAFPK